MPGQAMDTTVVEMHEKKLTIDIKPAKQRGKNRASQMDNDEDEDEEYDPPSSADIQVVHKHPIPNLHSILKQRTVSESSEDVVSEDPSSPRTCGEEEDSLQSSFSKRRSVSFNSYVDKASFKSSAAPSSMTPGLKSKRRRQRKHQQKVLNSRNRKNSGGTSSSEECLHVSDSMSHSEEELEHGDEKGIRSKAKLARATSDPGPGSNGDVEMESVAERTKNAFFEGKGGVEVSAENGSASHQESSPSTEGVQNGLDFRTIENGGSDSKKSENVIQGGKEGERKKKIVNEIKSKMAENGVGGPGGDGDGKDMEEEDSDDDNFEDAVSSIAEDLNAKVTVGDGQGGQVENGLSQKSDVDTMLSWEEGSKVLDNEHSTQCAFQFSNSIIFDLDVD